MCLDQCVCVCFDASVFEILQKHTSLIVYTTQYLSTYCASEMANGTGRDEAKKKKKNKKNTSSKTKQVRHENSNLFLKIKPNVIGGFRGDGEHFHPVCHICCTCTLYYSFVHLPNQVGEAGPHHGAIFFFFFFEPNRTEKELHES